MLVTSPNLPSVAPLVIDTGRGQALDAYRPARRPGRDAFAALLRVRPTSWLQGYRPGGLAALGFAPDAAARVNPGIVYVSLCAYSHEGPWAGRGGFDSLCRRQAASNDARRRPPASKGRKPLPAQILDHASGYLLAFAAMTALRRQRAEGGSWHVRLSLAQTGAGLRSLGRVDGVNAHDPRAGDVLDCLEESDSGFGGCRRCVIRH